MSYFVIVAIALAVVTGLVRGGSLDSLSRTQFRWTVLLLEGLLIQLVFDLWDPPGLTRGGALVILIASNAAVAGFLFLNRRAPGMLLIGVGLILNVIVISANQAMPVSRAAAASAGLPAPPASSGELKHELLNDETVLPFLADVIPIPGLNEVLSLGDVVLALGVARLVYARTVALKQSAPPAEASD